jgi:hypothetical protein
MKFVVKHATKTNVYLRKPRFVGDSVHWTEPKGTPHSVREPWVFATRSGAEKARDMHALDASVEPWYEAGDRAQSEAEAASVMLSPSNISRWMECPASHGVTHTAQCNTGMQDYILGAVLADLLIVSSDFGGC